MMPAPKFILTATCIALLSACGTLLPKPKDAPRQYTLSGIQAEIPAAQAMEFASLEIQRPTAAPGLDSDRVAHQSSPHRLDYLADARWAASAPSLLQNALVESFARSGSFAAVASDEASMKADYTLAIDLQSFQLVSLSGEADKVQIRLNARVMTVPAREVLKMQSFEINEPVGALNMEDVAAIFQKAYNQLAPQILASTTAALHSALVAPEVKAEPARKKKRKKSS